MSLLADIIGTYAINGKAHIVGLSLGAHVATALASAHPEMADTVFISGYRTFSNTSPEIMARALWLRARLEAFILKILDQMGHGRDRLPS